ncbi:MAG: hypothetical protein QXI07_11370 [Pyrobaculum sp.]
MDFVLRHRIYERFSTYTYENKFKQFDDGRIKEARIRHIREILPTAKEKDRMWLLKELALYGDEEAKKELERMEEEERRRREEGAGGEAEEARPNPRGSTSITCRTAANKKKNTPT